MINNVSPVYTVKYIYSNYAVVLLVNNTDICQYLLSQ